MKKKTEKATKKASKMEVEEESEGSQESQEEQEVKSTALKIQFAEFDDFVDGLGTWKESLKETWSGKHFKTLYEMIKKEYESEACYPPYNLIFNAFQLTPLNTLKVVIIGQDPYHEEGQAMGLAFSVPRKIKAPSSVKNIFKSLEGDKDLKDKFKKPNHADLTKWATQGVFLLNNTLTVRSGKPNSHKKAGWNKFTDEVIKVIDKECKNIVFLLWGADAHKKALNVDEKKHCLLKTSHPSGQSFTKGFSTACPFSKCNQYLKKNGLPEINWNLD